MKTLRTTISVSAGLLGLCALVAMPASADFVINDDLIVDGSACIGFDCVNGEVFSFDTIRLKENNLRIKFDDTSVVPNFPDRDWQITANESANGGQEKFSIEDVTAGRTPFTIEGNAPSHSLYVDDGGRLGLGTSVPSVELHIIDGDTPTLRLQQDGSSGFEPQTWDVAGNETNFFIRDVTNGSALPFRIQPGSPSNAIFISSSNGDVGFGTSSPDEEFEIESSSADDVIAELESTNGTAQNVGFRYINAARTWNIFNNNLGNLQFNSNTVGQVMSLNGATGDLTLPAGNCSDVAGGGGCTPDYVFKPGYELPSLEELAAFIAENQHLPNVPSAEENERHGVNVRRLSFAMLEKIEELVLYTLEQQETIQQLAETNAGLAERLEALEGKVAPDVR